MPEPTISLIIPVLNGGANFRQCLAAIAESSVRPHEIIVADDGSTDESIRWATAAGAHVLAIGSPGSGPAAARNLAASHATGDILFFCDADVQIRRDTAERIRQTFAADSTLDALFGSYDDEPGDSGFLSQYKNLFHHYIHQHGAEEAATFWSGCGAMRREAFFQHGGFSTRYTQPSIEDIELGYLLKRNGRRIRLDKSLQVKHLKRWTMSSLLRSDIVARGIPWTQLILREGAFLNDLNLQTHNRISVVIAYFGALCALAGFWRPAAWLGVPLAAAFLARVNWRLYRWFAEKRGIAFAIKTLAPHWAYYFYNGISFGVGLLLHFRERAWPAPRNDLGNAEMTDAP